MRIHSVLLLCCALFLLTLAGCPGGAETPKLVPVEGTITLDDEPLVGAGVMFGTAAVGETDASGHYKLTYEGTEEGVPPGDYAVIVEKWVNEDGTVYKDTEGMSPELAGAKQELPRRYADMEMTELKATVSQEGGKPIDFKLTSEPDSGN